jgi:hypothetical protein
MSVPLLNLIKVYAGSAVLPAASPAGVKVFALGAGLANVSNTKGLYHTSHGFATIFAKIFARPLI